MNTRDYLEYEGTQLLSFAMEAFQRPGSELSSGMEQALLMDQQDITAEEKEALLDFSWEYVLYRLYIASSMIRRWKGCFGCQSALLSGLSDVLSSIPSRLKLISLERDLSGSYLLLGRHADELTEAHVKSMFAAYEEIERLAQETDTEDVLSEGIALSLSRMEKEISMPLSPSLVTYLTGETKAFMDALSRRLSQMTPEKLHQCAHEKTVLHSRTSAFSSETYDRLYPSFTLAAGMAAGFLFMFA
jgi:hypothetical protein